MCGIAGIIHRDGSSDVGTEMTRMLQSMKHRGPDSAGYALFGEPSDLVVIRFKLADANDPRDFDFKERLERHRQEVESRLHKIGASVDRVERETEYAYRATVRYDGDMKALADYLEDVPSCEVLSLGHSLEIVKDLGDAQEVSDLYRLGGFSGTHAIGHVRMATESDVDISGAHPYWAYPFTDVAVVHNGQLTNYFQWKRRLESSGHRFQSECDSEIIAVYLAEKMAGGDSLEDAMHKSLDELDGVFTYMAVTQDALGVAKDEMAAKPLVLYESDGMVAMASEEIAIRAVLGREIDTSDPVRGAGARMDTMSGCATHHVRRARARGARRGGPTRLDDRGRQGHVRRERSHHAADQPRAPLPDLRAGDPRRHRAEPRREALDRRRDPPAVPDPLRGIARLLRPRPDRRARDHGHGTGRLVGLREHDVRRRRDREERRIPHGGGDPRR